jgi:hypothetical protein
MPVCITGMHRSGTSLVANLLRQCGLYLGQEDDLMPATADNEAGYWENRNFLMLNDEILRELGGTWDFLPVMSPGWAEEERLNPLRVKAEILVQECATHEPWGWKDPRTCLTLPFWASLTGVTMPFWYGAGSKLKVVLCIRNPFAVFSSLRDRQHTPNVAGFELWSIYNQSVLNATLPTDRIVTNYDSYFSDARGELRRVLSFLEMPAPEELIEHAVLAVSDRLRHQQFQGPGRHEDQNVSNLYRDLCKEANFLEVVSANN